MADDTYPRGYRPGGRGSTGAGGSSVDPLTELARLIGQSDPFAVEGQHRPNSRPPDVRRQAAEWRTEPQPDDPHDEVAPRYHDDDAGHAAPYSASDSYDERGGAHGDQLDDEGYGGAPYQDQGYGADGQDYPSGQFAADEEPGHPDDMAGFYDEAPPRRRGWVVTAGIFLGLALVGAGVAVAYHKVFVTGQPSIIAREPGPTKIIPNQNADSRTNKRVDRIASGGQDERLVSNEEQPIALPDTARSTPAPGSNLGIALPPSPGVAPGQPSPAADTAASGTAPGGAGPRKIRTVPIKVEGSPAETPAPAAAPAAPPIAARPTPASATAARAPAMPQSPPPAAAAPSGPLSLTPPDARHEPAATPARTAALAPRPPAPKPESGGASGYYVQVTAQKSEAEAESSFRGIQSKYASLLGSHEPVIRRKDLGSRGIFYGAQVGPFSHDAAVQLCESLKSAGGPCMVQKN